MPNGHASRMDDVQPEQQISRLVSALEHDLGEAVPHANVEHLAVTSYERVASGARIREFLPVLAERDARHVLHAMSHSV